MNIEQPWLILEFPFWLDDIEIEIFWYDGAVRYFFNQVRAAVVEPYNDPDNSDHISRITEARILELIYEHQQRANAHQQYLSRLSAQ